MTIPAQIEADLPTNAAIVPRRGAAQLRPLGVKLGRNIDQLFVHVTLPEGWTLRGDDKHDHISHLYDHRGLRRAEMYYNPERLRANVYALRVGYSMALQVEYGSETPQLSQEWGVLSDAEKIEFVESCRHRVDQMGRMSPTPYDRRERLQQALKLAADQGVVDGR